MKRKVLSLSEQIDLLETQNKILMAQVKLLMSLQHSTLGDCSCKHCWKKYGTHALDHAWTLEVSRRHIRMQMEEHL